MAPPLLHEASMHQRIECVRVLLKHGVDPDALAPMQLRPAANGHPPVLATALECALARHVHEQSPAQLSLVRALCDAGASPDLSGRPGETTPLLWACGDVSEGGGATSEVVKLLVEHGADPGVAVGAAEGVPLSGTTPLATAVNSRNKSVVSLGP